MPRSRYIIGIDLGTTNCAAAYVDTKGRERPTADIKTFAIPQLVAAGETAPRAMLPSFLYLPGTHELPQGAARLPWGDGGDRIVGEFARVQGGRVPAHLVSSAKSWLCHPGVDREAEILPWGATADARRVSPVEASAEYLRHLRDAWNATMARDEPGHRLEAQEIVLTVPASFDEAARELTVEAAKRAGYVNVTLLEEPQAAFYCWIVTHQEGWQKQVRGGELILVCDIGGGTTDFSLITVVETPTGPGFRRVAVGDHLMLGGDNMDLALAHRVEATLGGVKLDGEQWNALRLACRTAKEKLWGENSPPRWPVSIAGRGSKLIGGSIQSELTLNDIREVVLEGFFPPTAGDEAPSRAAKAGLQEFGLPFVSDPAIPRHLNAFLRRHRAEAIGEGGHANDDRPARPDAVLFNGGALTPDFVRQRIVDIVASWFPDDPGEPYSPRVLTNISLDLAVAIGAAYYGIVRRGGGIRIGGGTARAYYVGFESESQAKPWLCVVPRDAQEGDEVEIDHHDFELLMGQPVSFPLASSSVRADDRPGDLVGADPNSILPLPPLVGMMRVGRKAKSERVRVSLGARVTEIGTVELWCRSRTDERRWRLQIQLRGSSTDAPPKTTITGAEDDAVIIEQSELDAASNLIRTAFASSSASDEGGPTRLVKRLEELLDEPRDHWPPSALRAMWEPLRDVSERRATSPRHESRWLNLAGYCLRPGTGFPLDEARMKTLWPAFHLGLKHQKDVQCWADWWTLWRRVAAGLNRAHHEEIHRRLLPLLLPPKGGAAGKKPARPKPEAHELSEMWRCAGSLERLAPSLKEPLGDALARDLANPGTAVYALWALGRLGARVLLYGQANCVVHPDKTSRWVEVVLGREFAPGRESIDAVFALTQMARVSGDRARDLDESLRSRVITRLQGLGADEPQIRPVREFCEMGVTQQGAALGDSLPVGLRLATAE